MNKKQLIIIYFVLFVSTAYALPENFDWNVIQAVWDDKKGYDNENYKTNKEYKQAYYAGKCSSAWFWGHLDENGKKDFISFLKRDFKERDNVVITQSDEYYVGLIDEAMTNIPQAFCFKVGVLFKFIAIIEYDFDEGIDKDKTAKQNLGSNYQLVQEYRARNSSK
ncbi:MAG: hypothetical protein KKB22_02120 [Candidatus Omnitrophica bacterium]|nr:hypothetical protein [Candidatus Omnitrophota bacterium]